MADLSTDPGEIRFTMHITRAATGITETHEMVGHIVPPPPEQTEPINELTEGVEHGTNA